MKKNSLLVIIIVLFSFLSIPSSLCSELDEPLRILQPLLGNSWVGGFVGEDAPEMKISLSFEAILDGEAVRYTRTAPEAEFEMVTHFYFDPGAGEVRFLSLDNRGTVGQGTLTSDNGKLTLSGTSSRPGATTEFRTVLSIDSAGTLTDLFLRREKGEWVEGHVQKYSAR